MRELNEFQRIRKQQIELENQFSMNRIQTNSLNEINNKVGENQINTQRSNNNYNENNNNNTNLNVSLFPQATLLDLDAFACDDNLFDWHFTIRGLDESDYEGGLYHGRIILPPSYPHKPPDIMLLTENGRFELNTKICLSITSYHEQQVSGEKVPTTLERKSVSIHY